MEQAAGRSGLNHRTIEQLFRLGQTAPRSFPTPKADQLLVKVSPTTPSPQSTSQASKPVSSPSVNSEEANALKLRLSALEKRVSRLDSQVSRLDSQQEDFLARLESLDVQQEIFTAKLEQLDGPKRSPKSRPIQITLESIPSLNPPLPEISATLPETPLPVPVAPMGGNSLNNYQVANAISLGLRTHPDTGYRNWLYMRYQSMIRKLRSGADPVSAARLSRIELEHVKSVLVKGGVNPQEAGL